MINNERKNNKEKILTGKGMMKRRKRDKEKGTLLLKGKKRRKKMKYILKGK